MVAFGIASCVGAEEQRKSRATVISTLLVLPPSRRSLRYLEEVGFIPAMLGCTLLGAGREFKWKEVLALTIGLTILCTGMFIYGLGLPYPLIKGMWGY